MKNRFLGGTVWPRLGKKAAICFSIDDVHPSTSRDDYEAGGDLGQGSLGNLEWLCQRHPRLKPTLFITADWRCRSPLPTRRLLASIPWLRDRFYLAPVRRRRDMQLDRHRQFADYLRGLPRTDLAFHGLSHVARGPKMSAEFGALSRAACARRLRESQRIFAAAGLPAEPGLCPPGWAAPPALLEAMPEAGLHFLASARDIRSPIQADAVGRMSGLQGCSLLFPQPIAEGRLLHFPVNYQATNEPSRAREILDLGGLLHIKAHVVEEAFGYRALDALNLAYRDSLHRLFGQLEDQYGDSLWWTSPAEITREWPRAE